MTDGQNSASGKITRRGALLRLGLCAVAAYASPTFLTFDQALADGDNSGSDDNSGPGGGGGGHGASGPDGGDGHGASGTGGGGGHGAPGPGNAKNENTVQQEPDTCEYRHSSKGGATMPERDYRRAQAAVAEGRALPLREVFKSVIKKLGGRFVEVRFKDSNRSPSYQLRMISGKGALIAVQVEAATGRITNVADC